VVASAERSHNRIVQAVVESVPGGSQAARSRGSKDAHRMGGNALRARCWVPMTGSSPSQLVMGVAGASAASTTILLTGLAGLVAGACSMAMANGSR